LRGSRASHSIEGVKRWLAAIVIGVALIGATPFAHGEDDTLAAALTGEARDLYDIGRSLFEKNDYAAALPKFQRAYDLSSDPRLLWNVAACEASLKHWARAMTLVDRYVSIGGPRLTEADRAKAERFKGAAKQFVATVTLTTTPDGVSVAVDGESVGATPLGAALYLDAGKRRVVFTRAGHRGIVRVETVEGGADLTWSLTLEKLHVKSISN
jgi:hypothetical protein